MYSAAYGDPRESTTHKYLIVLIWIPVHLALRGKPRLDPLRVITPLRLMDPGVRLTPGGGSLCMPHSRSQALDLITLYVL